MRTVNDENNNVSLIKQCFYLVFFVLLFICISQSGIYKYVVLAALTVVFFLMRPCIPVKYCTVFLHSLVYIAFGLFFAQLKGSFSYESLKQILIYLSSGAFAVGLFSVFGKENADCLVECQFWGLIIAYILLFARYFTPSAFYYESSLYAYIFGIYVLLFFYRRKYLKTVIAVIFMLFEHKRITDAAAVFCLLCLVIIFLCEKLRLRRIVNGIGCAVILIVPLVWIFACRSGVIFTLFEKFGVNTMGRTAVWQRMSEYYEFSPGYSGKGIGWVLLWLQGAGISAFNNLHNDFLTAYIELGFIGYFFWLVSFVAIIVFVRKKSASDSNFVLVLIGYSFINFLTDNIYLYVTYLMPLYVILLNVVFGGNGRRDKMPLAENIR